MQTLTKKGAARVANDLGVAISIVAIQLKGPLWAAQLLRTLIWVGVGLILLICVLVAWILAVNISGMAQP